jgi:hypothetical protein
MAQPITRFERSSNSIFVFFVSFVVAIFPLIFSQPSEWRTTAITECERKTLPSGGGFSSTSVHRMVQVSRYRGGVVAL